MRRFLIPVLVFVAVFAVSCGGDKKTNNGGSSEEAKPVAEVSQEITAEEGGKIEAETKDEAVSIEIPAGALDEDVKITMKIFDAKGYKGTDGLDVISKVVEFEPSGIVFKKPVIITMKALKDVTNKIISAAVYRESKGEWSYSETGAAVKMTGRTESGDPIMTSASGDPIMLNASGDPIMTSASGDPIMLSASGDPIMVTASGDPIMNSASGDPIMMTTGHFTSYTFVVVKQEKTDDSDDSDTADEEIIDNDDSDADTEPVKPEEDTPVINDNDESEDADDIDADIDDDEIDDIDDDIDDDINDIEVVDDDADTDTTEPDSDIPEPSDTDTEPAGPDPCADDPCEDIVHSDGVCSVKAVDGAKTYACGCVAPYAWDGSKCSSSCASDPCSTVQHSTGICYPKPDDEYECGCAENYYWDGSAKKCDNPCLADPCGSVPHTTGCVPETGTEYVCTCEELYAWEGSTKKCVSPCDSSPCAAFEHATSCTAKASDFYVCGCEEGFYWWGTVKGCTAEQPVFGRICTSQLKCYDENREIPCPAPGEPFYGQDANKAREGLCAPKSFTIVDTGIEDEKIVRDNNTRLEWMKRPDSGSWRWNDSKSHCNDLSYGGYDDWRAPTPKEFLTIVDNDKKNPSLDMNYFDYSNDYLWTSAKQANPNDTMYWAVDFDSGELKRIANTSNIYVRCVRGDTMPESSFTIPDIYAEAEEKIVLDTLTGLQWQYNDLAISDIDSFWRKAIEYCENLTYAGFSDWRLPNKEELATIADYGRYNPASSFPDIANVNDLLTSTTIPEKTYASFQLSLPHGVLESSWWKTEGSSTTYHVRCVRSE